MTDQMRATPHARATRSRRRRGFTLIEIMIVLTILGLLILILLPNYVRARARSRLSACEENLQNMATACEMYADDNSGFYATSLYPLVPSYINSIPTCPSAPDSYSYINGYQFGVNPNSYTLECQGNYHVDMGIPLNYPQYIPNVGLVEQSP